VGTVVGLAVLGGVVGFLTIGQEDPASESTPVAPIEPNTLIRIDPASMEIDARYELSGVAEAVEFAAGRVWILEKGILEVLDPGSSEIERTGFGFEPCTMASTDAGIVVGDCEHHQLYRVDADLEVERWVRVPSFGDFFSMIETASGLWILATHSDKSVEDHMFLIDPSSGEVLRDRPLAGTPGETWQVAEAGGYLWTFNHETGSVLRIAPSTLEVTEIE
jgi:hypothetical protein